MRKALITGITGQDGAYLAQHLISKGYRVYGGARRTSGDQFQRLKALDILDKVECLNFDLSDMYNVQDTIAKFKFDEVYNLAAQSFVGSSWDFPIQTLQVNGMGPMLILDAIKRRSPETKFYQASTSEMFGLVQHPRQSEDTPFYPRSPYGVAKLAAHAMTVNYRESHSLFACSGILFNHESPLRGPEFVTKKITSTLANIKVTGKGTLELGNLNSQRDWGYAKEFVDGIWRMMQEQEAEDFVLATGKNTTVRDFTDAAASALDMQLSWEGEGKNEIGRDKKTGRVIVKVNPVFFRPAEVDLLLGDPSKAEKKLGWVPKTTVKQLAELMVDYDMQLLSNT